MGFKILTVGELPSHGHSAYSNTTGNHTHTYTRYYGGGAGVCPDGSSDQGSYQETSSNGNHSHTITINNTGSSQAHNNIQPYISVYIWKRLS